ncbi:hypothetical protein DID78_05010 [Candidatus Marinamargulisbacteria bacterium SCGC AG-343-D04]|nr:hypothetical protein DID78_05010 [Candidatus Marinamargulisbacteria bacterium SCGC AG-343-D04]
MGCFSLLLSCFGKRSSITRSVSNTTLPRSRPNSTDDHRPTSPGYDSIGGPSSPEYDFIGDSSPSSSRCNSRSPSTEPTTHSPNPSDTYSQVNKKAPQLPTKRCQLVRVNSSEGVIYALGHSLNTP